MAQQHIDRVYNGQTMLEAQVGTKGPAVMSRKRWGTCVVCGFDYPWEELVNGTHCIPLKHYEVLENESGIKLEEG